MISQVLFHIQSYRVDIKKAPSTEILLRALFCEGGGNRTHDPRLKRKLVSLGNSLNYPVNFKLISKITLFSIIGLRDI